MKNATKAGYEVAREGDGINLAYPDSETRREGSEKDAPRHWTVPGRWERS